MQISAISGFNIFSNKKMNTFKGETNSYNIHYGQEDLKRNSHWQKNSSVEKIVDSYHKNYTGKAYFAAPMEFVSDRIKDTVDYVVYDNEPSYPAIEDVEQNYIGKLRKDFRPEFEEVREYYYRRELGGFANVEEAKQKQKQAAECTGFYDRAGNARYLKEGWEDRIEQINQQIKTNQNDVVVLENEIAQKKAEKETWEIKKDNYTKKHTKYGQLNKLAQETIDKDEEELSFIGQQIKNMKQNIANCKNKIEECIATINSDTDKIGTKLVEIKSLKAEKVEKEGNIKNIIDKQLKPMIEGLKNFYKQEGIRVIKRG